MKHWSKHSTFKNARIKYRRIWTKKCPEEENNVLHKPPPRSSWKGGGLETYINTRICKEDDIEEFDPYSEPVNNSGEFQFWKFMNCSGLRKTVTLGNVNHLPASSNRPEKFLGKQNVQYVNMTLHVVLRLLPYSYWYKIIHQKHILRLNFKTQQFLKRSRFVIFQECFIIT